MTTPVLPVASEFLQKMYESCKERLLAHCGQPRCWGALIQLVQWPKCVHVSFKIKQQTVGKLYYSCAPEHCVTPVHGDNRGNSLSMSNVFDNVFVWRTFKKSKFQHLSLLKFLQFRILCLLVIMTHHSIYYASTYSVFLSPLNIAQHKCMDMCPCSQICIHPRTLYPIYVQCGVKCAQTLKMSHFHG